MSFNIRKDQERDRTLRRILKPVRKLVPDESGKHFKEKGAANVMYCENCKGPVADSYRARRRHAQMFPACAAAMEKRNESKKLS